MRSRFIALPIVAALALTGAAAPAFAATTWTVTSSADTSELGTLRYAIENSTDGDVIDFDPAVTSIAVGSALTVTHSLTIDGPGASALTISRASTDAFNLFSVMPTSGTATFDLSGLTVLGRDDGDGAGLYISNNGGSVGAVTVAGVEFRDGHTTGNGAAIRVQSAAASTLMIVDSLFDGNDAVGGQAGAGAVGLAGGPTMLTVWTSTFSNNSTAIAGGAVQATGPISGGFDTVLFENNSSTSAGGALALGGGTSYAMANVTATGNSSGAAGGGVISMIGTGALTIYGGSYTDNSSNGRGGVISASSMSSGLEITGATFQGNHAATDGGVLYSPALVGDSLIDTSRFLSNSAGATGGALMVSAFSNATSSLAITGSSFLGNSAGTAGGALQFTTVRAGTTVSATYSTFGHNTTAQSVSTGSSISVSSVSGTVYLGQTTVDDVQPLPSNGAVYIGTLAASAAQVVALFSTIVGPGGIVVAGSSAAQATLAVDHSIVASADAAKPGVAITGTLVTDAYYALVTGEPPVGNIGSADQFGYTLADLQLASLANNGGPTLTRMPAVTSPAVDSGDPNGADGDDQRGEGHPRTIRTVDVGAVELDDPFFADATDTASTVYPYTQWMFASGLSTGTPQTSGLPLYNPLAAVSRQAMASFLYRLSGDTFTPPTTPSFADVPTNASTYTAIEWMKDAGISTGTPQSSGLPLYKPADPVSRQAMALFLARYSGIDTTVAPAQQSFADVPVDASSAGAIDWMKTAGISTGTPQPSGLPLYKPADPVSRQAMAAFLYRMAHLY